MSDEQEPKLTVPKFASFRSKPESKGKEEELKPPKFSSFKPKESQSSKDKRAALSDDDHERDRDRGSKRKRSHHTESHGSKSSSKRHRDDPHRRHRDPERHHSRSAAPSQQTPSSKPKNHEDALPKAYCVDTEGDPLIIKYGGVERSHIPFYRRYGYGRVLGTAGRLIMHRDGARDQFSIVMPGEGSAAFRDKEGLRSKNWRPRPKPLRVRAYKSVDGEEEEEEEDEDFLALKTSKKRNKGHEGSESSDNDQKPSYRSIEGKARPQQYSDTEDESDSSVEATNLDLSNPLKWKSIQLSNHVKGHPENIDAWLELADHQDALLRAGEDIDYKAEENEAHSYSEIKLSMLESALSNVSSPADRARVLVPLMKEGVKVWTSKTTTKRWADMIKDEEANFELWKTHLDFSMSNIATFQYDNLKQMHLDKLHQTISRAAVSDTNERLSEAIYIFLRTTRFIFDSGHRELAVAAWQAILELNFCRPSHFATMETAAPAFSDFWESEVPRLGETGAQGWAKFVEDGGLGDAMDPVGNSEDTPPQTRDVYKRWATTERARAEAAKLPARMSDEGTDDDPFRVVMSTDIQPLLFIIPDGVMADIAPQLLDAFLIFSRLPPAFRSSHWTEVASQDPYVVDINGDVTVPEPAQNHGDSESEGVARKLPLFNRQALNAAMSSDILFADTNWFSYVPQGATKDHRTLSLVTNTLRHLVHVSKWEALAEFYLALCFIKDGAGVKKSAKALLKQYPTNLSLYGAYGLAEFASANHDVASKVLSSATTMTLHPSNATSLMLWRTWAWMELERGNLLLATVRLCSSVDESLRTEPGCVEVTSTQLLKAHQLFSSSINGLLSTGKPDEAAVYVQCLVLLSYLTAERGTEPTSALQGNISAALGIVQMESAEFKSRGHRTTFGHERILQFVARLLWLHAARGPFRRAYLLEKLSGFIEEFPRNTIFLSLFEWADTSLRVVDEVRTLLHDRVLTRSHDCVSSRVFAIQHEMQRGNVNTIRAAFEHCMSSDSCRWNTSLWVSYIMFCGSHRELRAKGKDVLFRALRHCPWSKDVMMQAFLTLGRDMESSELKSVFETMESKGLRVHVDLNEFLATRRKERQTTERGRP